MNSLNISDLVKAISIVIGISFSIGKFSELRDFALHQGIKAVSVHSFKPTYFFGKGHRQ